MNWPGAFCILDRLQKYEDIDSLNKSLMICLRKAKMLNDETWECNLNMLLQNRHYSNKGWELFSKTAVDCPNAVPVNLCTW